MINNFNNMGMACFGPQVGGWPSPRIATDDEAFIVETAKARPEKLGRPFTHWSVRKLAQCLATNPARPVVVGRESLREILAAREVTFQRAKTWREPNDPAKEAKLDRIDLVQAKHPERVFALACASSTAAATTPTTSSSAWFGEANVWRTHWPPSVAHHDHPLGPVDVAALEPSSPMSVSTVAARRRLGIVARA